MGVGNVASRCSKGKRGKMPPISAPWDRFVECVGSLLDVILRRREGGRGSITKHIEMLAVDV